MVHIVTAVLKRQLIHIINRIRIVTRLQAGRFGVRIPAGAMYFFSKISRPALGPTLSPIQWVPEAVFPGVKRLGREVDHSPPPGDELKNELSYTSTSPTCLHGVQRDNISLVNSMGGQTDGKTHAQFRGRRF
jgi:hypothetical protein